MTRGLELALAAGTLIGVPFRLHGRCRQTGVDCLGVLAVALADLGRPSELPSGYRLRMRTEPDVESWAARNNLLRARDALAAGDVLMMAPGPGQLHLMIVAANPVEVIEAHASLGKVVTGRIPSPEAVLHRWVLADIR